MQVHGRKALVQPGEDGDLRLVTTTAWGDLLVVGAEGTDFDPDDLVELAESVERA